MSTPTTRIRRFYSRALRVCESTGRRARGCAAPHTCGGTRGRRRPHRCAGRRLGQRGRIAGGSVCQCGATACRWTSAARSRTSSRTTRTPARTRRGKASTTPARSHRGRLRRLEQVVEALARDRVLRARHHRRAERVPPAARRACAAARHGGRRRHVPDRARQPDAALRRSTTASRRRSSRAATRSRSRGRLDWRRRGARRRSTRRPSAPRPSARATEGFGRSRRRFLFSYLNPAHELARRGAPARRAAVTSPSLALAPRGRASGASTSARRRPCSTPTPRPTVARVPRAARERELESAASPRRCT